MEIFLDSLSKAYGKVRALKNITLRIEPGQIVAVVGANGAGKTTLLRALAAIASPDSGRILYDTEEFSRDRIDLRRRFFFLPDFPVVFPGMSVLRHIGMVLRLYNVAEEGIEERVLELMRNFDVLTLAEAKMYTLSRGQAYKAALCALLAVDPELWMLDEPFASGMDPHGLIEIKKRMRAAAERGRTVLYSTQLLDLAETFSDKVCIVNKGEIRAFDSIAKLSEQKGKPGSVLEDLFATLREEK